MDEQPISENPMHPSYNEHKTSHTSQCVVHSNIDFTVRILQRDVDAMKQKIDFLEHEFAEIKNDITTMRLTMSEVVIAVNTLIKSNDLILQQTEDHRKESRLDKMKIIGYLVAAIVMISLGIYTDLFHRLLGLT